MKHYSLPLETSPASPSSSPTSSPRHPAQTTVRTRARHHASVGLHAKELRKGRAPAPQTLTRNLLISPVKVAPRDGDTVARQASLRVAQASKRAEGQEEQAEEVFTVEFRVYPFPPPRHPLCYPLGQPAPKSHSHAESNGLAGGGASVRKRLLRRWHDDTDGDRGENGGRSKGRGTGSDASQRLLINAPARATPKRARSPLPDERSDEESRALHNMPGAPRAASAPFDLDEGDPVLPLPSREGENVDETGLSARDGSRRRSDSVEQRGRRRRADGRSLSKYARVEGDAGCEREPSGLERVLRGYASQEDDSQGRSMGRYQAYTREMRALSRAESRNKKVKSGETRETRPVSDTMQCEDGADGGSDDGLEELKSSILWLKEQRRTLEEKELDEIARISTDQKSSPLTKEDRLKLKRDIERLRPQAVRDVLRLISRKMRGVEVSAQVEVKLQLDILPADLTRELQLLVKVEKGEMLTSVSEELRKVRAELKEAVRDYRRQTTYFEA